MTENSQNIGVRCTNTSKIPPCDEYLSGALPKIVHPVPSLSFFLNTSTGADTNSGTNAGSPVLTLGRILALMENSSADVGIIEITSATLALGANPTIDLFPLAGRYGKIIFRGPKTTLATDTVAAAATYAPNLIGVNGTTAGYTAGAFAKKYIVNLTTAYDLRSAIITNTAGNISSIVSLTSSGYFDGTTLPWTALDAFQVFDISTVVTWSGTLNVIIEPMNRVFFDSLIMRPSANATFMYTPRAFDPQLIQFRSCQLESVGAALGVTYIGDYIIEGCYCLSALASDRILNFGALYAFNNYIERE